MGIFKVPSPTPSPSSSQGSLKAFSTRERSPGRPFKSILKRHSATPLRTSRKVGFRKCSGRIFRVPSVTPSATSSEADADYELSSNVPAGEIPASEVPERLMLGSDFLRPTGSEDEAVSSLGSFQGTEEASPNEMVQELPHYEQPNRELPNDTISYSTWRIAQNILTHPNIVPLVREAEGEEEERGDESISKSGVALQLNDIILCRSLEYPSRITTGLFAEAFIWHTLVSLLRAVHYLHSGCQSSSEEWVSTGWQPIVGSFINPTNIIYTEPHEGDVGDEAVYGTCMLRNFSRCVVLPRVVDPEDEDETEQSDRKEAFSHVSALADETGFEAPEYFNHTDGIPGPASDLWSIGAVMVTMMTGRSVRDLVHEGNFIKQASYNQNRRSSCSDGGQDVDDHQRTNSLMTLGAGELTIALPKQYSESLKILVDCLLASNPLERGTALDVLKDCEQMQYGRSTLDRRL